MLYGRDQEKEILQNLYQSNQPEFLAVYGRRRVGKTYLIRKFFEKKGIFLEVTGSKGAPKKEQLYNFWSAFKDIFDSYHLNSPISWQEAFERLRKAIERSSTKKRIVLFFDELPWLATHKSGCLRALEYCWNRYWSNDQRVILIVCGSSASWMIRKVIQNKGGLYGRLTRVLRLLPFTIKQVEEFLKHNQVILDRKQLIEVYMAIGGIPQYLNFIEQGRSSSQIINDLFFSKRAPLQDEFRSVFQSLFDLYDMHLAIVKALASAPNGLTQKELSEKGNLSLGGTLSKAIRELEESGFIAYFHPFKSKTGGKYRLVDEYCLFYLRFVQGLKIGGEQGDPEFWLKKQQSASYYAWAGLAFESICFKHLAEIKQALGIAAVLTDFSSWTQRFNKHNSKGTQIDLIIDRADRCINLVEIKFCNSEFNLTREYSEKLQQKKEIFRKATQTKKTLFTTLLTTFGAKKNLHYLATVDQELTIDALF